MKKLLKILFVSTIVLALLVGCGKSNSTSEAGVTVLTNGTEDITLYHDGKTVSKFTIALELNTSELELAEGETIEDYYIGYEEFLKELNIDIDYKIDGDTVKEVSTIDLSKVSVEDVKYIWEEDFFIFDDNDNISYEKTVENLKSIGYTQK